MNKRILLIQTSFIGDVILATALIESLNKALPEYQIDFLLRKGNEQIAKNNPNLREVLIWDKTSKKYGNLLKLIRKVRSNKYSIVVNLQRFGATGLLTALSGANEKWGFSKNPFSFAYTRSVKHEIGNGMHETKRNLKLISHLPNADYQKPAVYPDAEDEKKVSEYKSVPYICLAPTSVWFTKQLPASKWLELIQKVPEQFKIFLLGAASDKDACDDIAKQSGNKKVVNLAGKLSLLQSAALMKDAEMNYVNDSAPMHLASAVNAKTTVFFCSTIPEFGFGPLSDNSGIIETKLQLRCRPCGLHGKRACPEGHFKCATTIEVDAGMLK